MKLNNKCENKIGNEKNTILFGFGPHAKRIYINLLKENNLPLDILVDLKSKESELNNNNELSNIKLFFIEDSEKDKRELSSSNYHKLQQICMEHNIKYAIISTEPKSHFAYITFCLENNINILIDKPITVPTNFNNLDWYKEIYQDYKKIYNLYKNRDLKFYIMCQRRAHNGFLLAFDILQKTMKDYNIPITYLDIYHSDGVLNMPIDFINRENHPYKYGYGKL
ncbi:MAG: Gfo/Idh/MocA family oxidoreductase, partial [Clostridia bacterium]